MALATCLATAAERQRSLPALRDIQRRTTALLSGYDGDRVRLRRVDGDVRVRSSGEPTYARGRGVGTDQHERIHDVGRGAGRLAPLDRNLAGETNDI